MKKSSISFKGSSSFTLSKMSCIFFISASWETLRSTMFVTNSVFINFSSSMIACFSVSTAVSRIGFLYIFSSTSSSLSLFGDA